MTKQDGRIRRSMKRKRGELSVERFLIPYRVYGNADRVIVCVNGAQQTMAAWKSVVSYFFKDYSLVLFDFPGQGRARILTGPTEVSLDEQVRVLHQVVIAQRVPGRCDVVGASWGGIVVAVFASQYPELVGKIILASFGAKTSKKMLRVIRKGMELYESGRGDEVSALIIENFGQHLSEAYKKKICHQFASIKKEHFRAFYAHGSFLENGHSIDEVVELANIKATTLIISGEHDTIMDLDDLRIVSSQIPNCETRIIRGVGHFLHNEREDILDIYKQFLSSRTELTPKLNGKLDDSDHRICNRPLA